MKKLWNQWQSLHQMKCLGLYAGFVLSLIFILFFQLLDSVLSVSLRDIYMLMLFLCSEPAACSEAAGSGSFQLGCIVMSEYIMIS